MYATSKCLCRCRLFWQNWRSCRRIMRCTSITNACRFTYWKNWLMVHLKFIFTGSLRETSKCYCFIRKRCRDQLSHRTGSFIQCHSSILFHGHYGFSGIVPAPGMESAESFTPLLQPAFTGYRSCGGTRLGYHDCLRCLVSIVTGDIRAQSEEHRSGDIVVLSAHGWCYSIGVVP